MKIYWVGYLEYSLFNKGHIPDSSYFDTNNIELDEEWTLKQPEDIESILLKNRMCYKSQILLYGYSDNLAASRLGSLLLTSGVKCGILDGGYKQWIKN